MQTVRTKNVRMPKPYLLEVINDYFEVENNIDGIIQTSGYKNQYIANRLKLPLSTYYGKKKTKSFTSKEVFQIVRMLNDDDEASENEYLLELAKSRMMDIADDEIKTGDELIAMLRK